MQNAQVVQVDLEVDQTQNVNIDDLFITRRIDTFGGQM